MRRAAVVDSTVSLDQNLLIVIVTSVVSRNPSLFRVDYTSSAIVLGLKSGAHSSNITSGLGGQAAQCNPSVL